jgi:alkaline phosphatase
MIQQRLAAARGEGAIDAATAAEIVRDATGIALSDAERSALAGAVSRHPPPELNQQHSNVEGVLGQALGNHNGIGWTGITHTADLAMVMARGPGASRFAGLLLNTQAYDAMTALLGVRHVNPQMSPDDARRFRSQAPPAEYPCVV